MSYRVIRSSAQSRGSGCGRKVQRLGRSIYLVEPIAVSQTNRAPQTGVTPPTPLQSCLGDKRWNWSRSGRLVKRHEGQVGGERVSRVAGEDVLGLNPDTHLHRGSPRSVDGRP